MAPRAPLSMGFSRQECRSRLPCPPSGDLPDPGTEPGSLALQVDSLPSEPPRNPAQPSLNFMHLNFTVLHWQRLFSKWHHIHRLWVLRSEHTLWWDTPRKPRWSGLSRKSWGAGWPYTSSPTSAYCPFMPKRCPFRQWTIQKWSKKPFHSQKHQEK